MTSEEIEEKRLYEERLQRRLQILKKQLDAGKVKISEHLIDKVSASLEKIRYAHDGSIDLNTVDALIRSMALGVEHMHDREELKASLSLAEIQTTYFQFLENNFGHYYKIMLKRGLTPHEAGIAISSNKFSIEELVVSLKDILETINEFWSHTAEIAHAHVEDMYRVHKGVFGGDLFPSSNENIASKCGIYTDTIILPDPFLRSKHIFELGTPQRQAYYLIKHALNLLQYKELACANIVPPLVVVLPDISAMEDEERQFFYKLGKEDALIHAAKIFGRTFESFDELMEFASSLDTIERVEAEVVDQKRVLFDTEWDGDLRSQLTKAAKEDFIGYIGTTNPGIIVASQALGRMSTSNELLVKARRLHGTPIIDAPTSWQYFVWKLEYDAMNVEQENNPVDLHVLRGLQSLAENEMEWLGKVPPDALIELRKADALGEIRAILAKGINELALANPTNFHRTSDQVFDNIDRAFSEHRNNIKELTLKKWKFAGSDIGSWLVTGSLWVTSAATNFPIWGLAAIAADQLLDAPKLRDIPKSIKKLAEESSKLKQSPVGMLFKYSQRKS